MNYKFGPLELRYGRPWQRAVQSIDGGDGFRCVSQALKSMLRLAKTLFGLSVLLILGLLGLGEVLSRPVAGEVGEPPAALEAETLSVPVVGGAYVAGWYASGTKGSGAVLLLHSVRSDRREMAKRALFLKHAGYSVLMIDLPAHGESPGDRITFGANESKGVEAALAYLASRVPGERIAVIGVSLGAASFVMSKPTARVDAVVLESMYPTIEEAVQDRLAIRLGAFGPPLAPLLLWQIPLRTGIPPTALRPIDDLSKLKAPILIASGTLDRHTTIAQTHRLFEAAGEPKALWAVEGAAHVNLHDFNPGEYESRVLAFLAKYLRPGA